MSAPDGQRVPVQFVHVVKGVSPSAVYVRDFMSLLGSPPNGRSRPMISVKGVVVPEEFELAFLDEEESALHPPVGDAAGGVAADSPRADKAVQGS